MLIGIKASSQDGKLIGRSNKFELRKFIKKGDLKPQAVARGLQ